MDTLFLNRIRRWLAAACATTVLAACGGLDENAVQQPAPAPQAAPTITSVTATPAALPPAGGTVTLAWVTNGATTLGIDNGVGDVSGSTSKTVNVSANTTFKLTATNAAGSVSASTAVTVAALPAPTITSFTATPAALPASGGAVTLAWASTDAATLSIDSGVGAVIGTNKVVNVVASTTFTLTATNPIGSVTRTTAVTVAAAALSTRYIDAALGLDTNPCTQAAPCQSLTKAMAGAPAGSTFLLADGVYSPDTEGAGGINIPDGATVQAIHPGAASLASLATNVVGSATLNGLVIDRRSAAFNCGGVGAGSAIGAIGTPTLTLIGVFSNCPNWLSLGGKIKATMTPGALPGGAYTSGLRSGATQWLGVNGAAELLIQGGVIDGQGSGNAYPQAGLLTATGTATLTLDAVTVRNWPQAVLAASGGTVVLRNGTLIDAVGKAGVACGTGSAMLVGGDSGRLVMDHATLSNAAGAGICVLNNFNVAVKNSLQLTQSTITRSGGAAIQSETTQGLGITLTADGLSLTNNGYGIFWTGRSGSSFDLRNSTISGSTLTGGVGGIGIYLYFAELSSLKLRGSTVSGNVQYGVEIDGNLTADLGTAAAPGGNSFTGNGLAGVRSAAASGQFVDAVGNTWIANQQGADANGRYSTPPLYTPVPKTGPASGINFKIDNATALNL